MIEYALGALVASPDAGAAFVLGVIIGAGLTKLLAIYFFQRAIKEARAEAAELRRVLEMVEWEYLFPPPDEDADEWYTVGGWIEIASAWGIAGTCPWCGSTVGLGHAPDCTRQAALGESDAKTID